MRMGPLVLIAAGVGLGFVLLLGPASAQDAKKKSSNNSAQQAAVASTGYPACRGLLFVDSYCVRRDGKVCTVGEGGGTSVALRDCR